MIRIKDQSGCSNKRGNKGKPNRLKISCGKSYRNLFAALLGEDGAPKEDVATHDQRTYRKRVSLVLINFVNSTEIRGLPWIDEERLVAN